MAGEAGGSCYEAVDVGWVRERESGPGGDQEMATSGRSGGQTDLVGPAEDLMGGGRGAWAQATGKSWKDSLWISGSTRN